MTRSGAARDFQSLRMPAAVLEPLLALGPAARDELVEQADQQRTSLAELARRLDLSRAASAEDEMRELCRAFTTGTCDVIRERRIRLAACVAGCEGIEAASVHALSLRLRLPAATIVSDVERVFRRIAQAAVLGLLPSTPQIDRSLGQVERGPSRDVAMRFAVQVLLKERPAVPVRH